MFFHAINRRKKFVMKLYGLGYNVLSLIRMLYMKITLQLSLLLVSYLFDENVIYHFR